MQTIRKKIAGLLANMPMTAREISQAMGIQESDVFSHLEHIKRSAKASGKRLKVKPPLCLACGFEFKRRDKLSPPGRCPECRSTHIQDPEFSIG